MKSKIEKILEKCKKKEINSEKIEKEIRRVNYEMQKVRRDYQRKYWQSLNF